MTIWVDADACPNVIKDILFRAAERSRIELVLVANQWIRTPSSRFIRAMQVPGGLDVADSEIVQRVESGDLVVTADIPLAALVVEKGALALDPRGQLHTPDTIAQRLSMRDFMADRRCMRATAWPSPTRLTAGWPGAARVCAADGRV